jgi:PAS domain S-box-containing protein
VSEPPEASLPTTSEDALSKLKEVEAQLQRMTKIFMDGADPIVIRDMGGNVLDANREAERVFGWKRDEVRGTRAKLQLAPEYRDLADEILQRLRNGETVRNVEVAVLQKGGGEIPVLATVFTLTNEENDPIGYAEITKDITQLKRANQKLQQRNQELTQFANVLAHDLRAPLNTIRGFADLVQHDFNDARGQRCRDYLHEIIEGADRMERLISDILAYALVESQPFSKLCVDCQDAYEQAIANLHAAIVESDAVITCDPLPTIRANQTQMVQLFQNLIGNAIKFRGVNPPRIHVSCEGDDGQWKFSVRDNGIGMDEKNLNRVFDAFHRLHADSAIPGAGIGLSICRGIVERHDGQIWVESEKGKGSVFRFVIPS